MTTAHEIAALIDWALPPGNTRWTITRQERGTHRLLDEAVVPDPQSGLVSAIVKERYVDAAASELMPGIEVEKSLAAALQPHIDMALDPDRWEHWLSAEQHPAAAWAIDQIVTLSLSLRDDVTQQVAELSVQWPGHGETA